MRLRELEKRVSCIPWALRSLTVRQEGQGMIEYGLILVLVALLVIIVLVAMGKQVRNMFSNVVVALG